MIFSVIFSIFPVSAPIANFPWKTAINKGLSAAPVSGTGQLHDIKELHDIKDVIALAAPFPWWYLLAGLLLFTGVIILIVWWRRRQKNRQSINTPSAGEQALQALEAARDLMRPEQSRAFGVTLAEILRTYIEQRFHLFQPNLTTREFLQALTGTPEKYDPLIMQHNRLLQDWLNHCDMVKFARYTLSMEEMAQMLDQVHHFITTTGDTALSEHGENAQ